MFDVSDAVLMQKWLYGDPEAVLEKWQAGDLFRNNRIDAVDFTMMKRRLLAEMVEVVQPEKWFTAQNAFCISGDDYNIYTGPGDEYAVIQTVKPFEWFNEIGVMENNDDWVYASCSGVYGWVRVVGKDGRPNLTPVGKMIDKPVIYLYPEQETDVHVTLELTESKLSTTYPRYNDGWDVTAYPDGTLLNKADGTHHKYLFWDSTESRTKFDFSRGFCVAGSDTEQFLKEKLTYMGLTEDEMNEFIVYWLPRMEHNAYNLIAFQGDVYTNSAKLNITPAPDSLCRVFMAYIPLDKAAEIEPQQLETFERKGFAVVEWGGTEIGARH